MVSKSLGKVIIEAITRRGGETFLIFAAKSPKSSENRPNFSSLFLVVAVTASCPCCIFLFASWQQGGMKKRSVELTVNVRVTGEQVKWRAASCRWLQVGGACSEPASLPKRQKKTHNSRKVKEAGSVTQQTFAHHPPPPPTPSSRWPGLSVIKSAAAWR